MVAALSLLSCTKEGLDPLSKGDNAVFPPAEELVLTTLNSSSTAKTETTREFSLSFSGENGASLETVLILARAEYALKAGAYVPGETSGSFIPARTKINGKSVSDKAGVITVRNMDGSSKYIVEFALFDANANAYRTKWEGELLYAPDPEPVALSVVLSASSNVASGTNSVTLSLATPGVTYDAATYSYTGNGNYLAVDFYSADGYLHEGVYTASAVGGVINEGEFGIGWDPGDLWGIGMIFENWGTCWWTVDGTATAEKITSGTISVEKKGAKWVITWGEEATYPKWAVFEGEIEALTPQGGDQYDGVTLTQILGTADYTGYGINLAAIELGTDGITVTPGAWGNTYGGDGNYLKLELYSTDGKIAPGTYKACAVGGAVGEGEFGIGYDGQWGASGTTWYTLVGGEATYQYITDGTVTVEVDGDNYKISIESSVINARFGYPAGGGDEFVGVILSQFCGASDYTGYGINLAGVELATDGITVTPGAWGNTYGGDGNYIKLEFYSTDGTLTPGEYKACAVGGNVGEGEFGIGYDGQWGASGTTWYTLVGGEASYVYITDGTLKVEKDGDVYTIVLQSSVTNIKYVGKLAAE